MAIRTEQDQLLNDVKTNTLRAIQPSAATYIADTNAHTGPFYAITCVGTAPAVVDVSECDMSFLGNVSAESGTNDITIPLGVTIYGDFASIELDSGAVIGYIK